ncbi:MAG TPA: YbjN domain-containing protein [Pyrinomonadaceae bacterium]|nr:YbjN domain-containing protein [Pyrinomonadaceae bacterium]HMP64636.1 YbjN domain-containing protein [Pyrinomonadaceae bacterium]
MAIISGKRIVTIIAFTFTLFTFQFVAVPNAYMQGPNSQLAASDRIHKKITRDQIRAIMVREGYSVTTDEDGDIVWKIEGYSTLMLVASDSESLMFSSSFTDSKATLEKTNEWNRKAKYSRSYIDNDGDPVLELDLDLAGGVTDARIVDFLKTCRGAFVDWVSEVVR